MYLHGKQTKPHPFYLDVEVRWNSEGFECDLYRKLLFTRLTAKISYCILSSSSLPVHWKTLTLTDSCKVNAWKLSHNGVDFLVNSVCIGSLNSRKTCENCFVNKRAPVVSYYLNPQKKKQCYCCFGKSMSSPHL